VTRARYLPALLALALSSIAAADHLAEQTTVQGVVLVPVPQMDLSGAESRAQEAIREARRNVDALLTDGGTSAADLGEAFGRLGAYYHVYNILSGAEACYRNAVLLAPDNYRWRHLLAYLTYASGRYEEALSLIANARGLDPEYPALDLYEGHALLGLNRVAEAEPLLHKAMQQEGLEAAAARYLGTIALQRREFDTAIDYFNLSLEADPAGGAVYFPLAQALRGAGRAEEARAALGKRTKDHPHVGDPIVEQLEALDQGSRPFYVAGLAAARQGDYAAVAEAFARGLEQDSDNYRARTTYARALYLSGRFAKAREELERVEAMAPPQDVLAVFLLGVMDGSAGDSTSAARRFGVVLAAHPDHSGALYFQGLIDFAAGNYSEAAERLEKAVAAEPGNRYAQVLALVARERSGADQKALLTELEALHEIAQDPFVPRYALSRLLAASPDEAVRDPARALALTQELVAGQPSPPAFEALALAKAAVSDFTGAEQALEQAKSGYFFNQRFADLSRMDRQLEKVKNGGLPAEAWPRDDLVLSAPVISPQGPMREYPDARAY